MDKYTVSVTRVTTYSVEAPNAIAAERAALGELVFGATIPQIIGEDTLSTLTERDVDVVQVVFSEGGSTYAYTMPDGLDYRIGDKVVTPATGFSDRHYGLATIVGVGRGPYTGPLKEIVALAKLPS